MTTEDVKQEARSSGKMDPAIVLESIAEALQGLKFGQINITVHDGLVAHRLQLSWNRGRPL